jgi:hypothetical protein
MISWLNSDVVMAQFEIFANFQYQTSPWWCCWLVLVLVSQTTLCAGGGGVVLRLSRTYG